MRPVIKEGAVHIIQPSTKVLFYNFKFKLERIVNESAAERVILKMFANEPSLMHNKCPLQYMNYHSL